MTSGVTVSPSALSAAAHASYKNVATSPAIIIKIYDTAIPIKSFDTFKNVNIDEVTVGTGATFTASGYLQAMQLIVAEFEKGAN